MTDRIIFDIESNNEIDNNQSNFKIFGAEINTNLSGLKWLKIQEDRHIEWREKIFNHIAEMNKIYSKNDFLDSSSFLKCFI